MISVPSVVYIHFGLLKTSSPEEALYSAEAKDSAFVLPYPFLLPRAEVPVFLKIK